jgi:hypothetical protein
MNEQQKQKLEHLCYLCKKGYGYRPTSEENEFLADMSRKFPQEYDKIHDKAVKKAVKEINPLG